MPMDSKGLVRRRGAQALLAAGLAQSVGWRAAQAAATAVSTSTPSAPAAPSLGAAGADGVEVETAVAAACAARQPTDCASPAARDRKSVV